MRCPPGVPASPSDRPRLYEDEIPEDVQRLAAERRRAYERWKDSATTTFPGGSRASTVSDEVGVRSRVISQPEPACLAIADISGYTDYLNGVELDHAQDVLMDLLSTVVEPLRPTFHLAKLEGDAVFLYAPVETIDGSILLDRIEACYFAFQHRLLDITQATTCPCNACVRIPDLDLKLVVHHGSVLRHEVLGSEELVGRDVIVVHRLLKNRIVRDLDIAAYALLTDACVAATDLDPAAVGMTRYTDDFEGVGTVSGWIHDLAVAWANERERQPTYVRPEEAIWTSEGLVPDVPASAVWEWITIPARKLQWELGFDDVTEDLPEAGRRGPGMRTHCMHGDAVITNSVVDWHPPHYLTVSGEFPDGTPYLATDEIIEEEGGTRVRKSMKAATDGARAQLEALLATMGPAMDTWIPTLIDLATTEHRSRPAVEEVRLPPSRARWRTPDDEAVPAEGR